MKRLILLLILPLTISYSYADRFTRYFATVFIDAESEKIYGNIPLGRKILAKAINNLAEAGAKGVVLKFFIDQAKDIEGDRALAESFSRLPVILQARIDDAEPSPNRLPVRFKLPHQLTTSINGSSGWIPAPRFSSVAYDIGFADYRGFPMPLFETYQGMTVKSLLLPPIELAMNEKVMIEATQQARVGEVTFNLDTLNRVNVKLRLEPDLKYLRFHDVMEKNDWVEQVKNKVVILGYLGPNITTVKTSKGTVSTHKLYVSILKSLLNSGNY